MEIVKIDGLEKLKLITGLHIGASDDSMKIGGVDSPVITREVLADNEGEVSFSGTNKLIEPYIAGSSLKGKVRSLLELYFRLIDPTESDERKRGIPINSKATFGDKKKRNLIIKLFGEGSEFKGSNEKFNLTRVIFRDCFITDKIRKATIQNRIELFEEKAENVIDRVTGATRNGGLRHIQRVVSSVEFDFDLSIRVFDGESRELFENTILLGLRLLELDALGGSGSRGYGKVKFDEIGKSIEDLRDAVEAGLKNETD
jgi:CRISPR-associated protein Csm3